LANSGTQHDSSTSGEVFVIAGSDFKRMSKRHSMADVVRLGDCTVGIFVHQHNLTSHAVHDHGIAGRCTDKSAANNSDLHNIRLN
jgi:hypothetical protein